ncbi:hypothetical protein [Paenibacillus xerothermodurans]|uniref:Uncharacterized protein n=1 Tax=Paenibacillus xerothermodurans TaxID=1977292 RepID=A0A2W1NV25_PAEXE|nr:hypothetical protein [Paenibacillus xerothermodurans]PZE21616.1 hypothetical protein CBW46_004105 [Paenibacillus xerothermodurans]
MLKLTFANDVSGYYPLIQNMSGPPFIVEYPVVARYLHGNTTRRRYAQVRTVSKNEWRAVCGWCEAEYAFEIVDLWREDEGGGITVNRSFRATRTMNDTVSGSRRDQAHLDIALYPVDHNKTSDRSYDHRDAPTGAGSCGDHSGIAAGASDDDRHVIAAEVRDHSGYTREASASASHLHGLLPQGGGGVQLQLQLAQLVSPHEAVRFHAPGILYASNDQLHQCNVTNVYMDDRLTYPLVLGYHPASQAAVCFARTRLSTFAEQPVRQRDQARYAQKTDTGSLGYTRLEHKIVYQAYLPYFEGQQSVALNAEKTPASAFYPLTDEFFELSVSYELQVMTHEHYAAAVLGAFKRAAKHSTPEPVQLPFSLENSIRFRSSSLQRSYREHSNGAAGFFFHFDPRHGYESPPSGFGASFVNIPHESYLTVLEYGFTGRQINAAYTTAKSVGGEWWDRGKRVIDFFIQRCQQPSGWMYTLYEVAQDRPLYSFGDPTAPKLHYVAHGTVGGNYVRLMVEPAYDLLLAYQLYRDNGRLESLWLEAAIRFADFLVRCQNADGSWYRAYEPNGTPLKNAPGFGDDEFSSKSATIIPVMFLLALWQEVKDQGGRYYEAAKQAADFVLATYVAQDHYQGGTLDNPNVIDKEAAQYSTAALFTLYKHTGDSRYLTGAERAAQIFTTWNYIWHAPTLPGTALANAGFSTIGCGGINSIWGGGVVDIYSLFFLQELYELGQTVGEPFYCEMSKLIAAGTQQLLSYPDDLMGFADIGMQPEGFGVCWQGVDDGFIAKGDIWGTLGWIYTAGIFGLGRYLDGLKIPDKQAPVT